MGVDDGGGRRLRRELLIIYAWVVVKTEGVEGGVGRRPEAKKGGEGRVFQTLREPSENHRQEGQEGQQGGDKHTNVLFKTNRKQRCDCLSFTAVSSFTPPHI
jgi:hypothetical protein